MILNINISWILLGLFLFLLGFLLGGMFGIILVLFPRLRRFLEITKWQYDYYKEHKKHYAKIKKELRGKKK